MSKVTRQWTRLDGVDLLRSLAIFFVLMNHVNMRLRLNKVPYSKGLPDQLVQSIVWNGQMGVQIFFVVSGFLITATTIRRWGSLSQVNVREFYRLRFARIAPLLLLLLAVLSALHSLHVNNFVVQPKTGGLGRALLAVLTFHVNVLEASRGYLPANWDILWSLSVEEMFYLFFPLLCSVLRAGRLLVSVLGIFVLLGPIGRTFLAGNNGVWQEYSYLGGMDAIALGCLTAIPLSSHPTFSPRLFRALVIGGTALVALPLCFSLQLQKWHFTRFGLDMTILAVGTCLLIAAAERSSWRSPPFLRPFLELGQRSYEIYLTHMFVVFALFNLFLALGKPMWSVPLLFLAVMLTATILGELVARLYSEPLNRKLRQTLTPAIRS